MRKLFTISLLASLLLCGCQITEPEITEEEEQYSLLTATIDDGFDNASTRTSLDSKGNVLWKKSDQISAFIGSTGNDQYQVTDASEGKTLARLKKIPSTDLVATTDISNNVAFYPYTYDAEIYKEEEGVSYRLSGITLPATQTYAEDSFGNGAFPMAAVTPSTTDTNLKFKNILGAIKFQLKGSARIASISIRGNADEILCGAANITVSTSATPTIELTDAEAKTVTLDCGTDGVQLNTETATSFVIALPPVVMASGFTATVTDTYGRTMEIKSVKSQEIRRSRILKMTPVLDYVGTVQDYNSEPFTITSVGNTTVALVKEGTPADITLEYRTGGTDWATYTIGTEISLSDGAILQFRAGEGGNSTFSYKDSGYDEESKAIIYNEYRISVGTSGNIRASGNVMSLLDNTLSIDSMPDYCFYGLFTGCLKLIDAANLKLPVTTLSKYCYSRMFSQCSNLTLVPELPATTMLDGSYYKMFECCTSLSTAPSLPSTTLADSCYSHMFDNCSSLTSAPALPAKTLYSDCYCAMFSGCNSLTVAPKLSATTLAACCYNGMFLGCTGLTTAPELPATTVANSCYTFMFSYSGLTSAPKLPAEVLENGCYARMFAGCSSLTSAPILPATTMSTSCYSAMFEDCTSLTMAPDLPATTLADNCYFEMFRGCTGLTTTPELSATTLAELCYCGMFSGCTSLNSVSKLPATTLAWCCYYLMFSDCTSLTSAPDLPATELVDCCYEGMFQNCSNLSHIKALFTTEPSDTYTKDWVSGVASEGTFVKSSAATWDVTGVNGVPSGWTVSTE